MSQEILFTQTQIPRIEQINNDVKRLTTRLNSAFATLNTALNSRVMALWQTETAGRSVRTKMQRVIENQQVMATGINQITAAIDSTLTISKQQNARSI